MPQTPILPAFSWGTPDTPATAQYSKTTVTVTASQTDPYGGTAAALLTRTSAGDSYILKTFTPSRYMTYPVFWFLKAGTATASKVSLEEQSGPARCELNVTWSGGTPSVSAATGTALAPVSVGGGWWMIRGITTQLDASKVHLYVIRPDNAGTNGTCYFYARNTVLFDVPDSPMFFRRPREGSEFTQGRSGIEDAWLTGIDYHLQFDARFIHSLDTDSPATATGWWGRNDTVGVGASVEALLEAGWRKEEFYYSPLRSSLIGFFGQVYLFSPMDGQPTLEPNAQERISLGFRSPASDLSIL